MTNVTSDLIRLVRDKLGRSADHILIYNNYDLTEGSILLFPFEKRSATPFAVLKLGRDQSALLREYENLLQICSICPGLAATPLFIGKLKDHYVLCTEPLKAHRITGYRAQSRKLHLITVRLTELQKLLLSRGAATTVSRGEYLNPFEELYDTELPAGTADYFNSLAADGARRIESTPVPGIPQHGDLFFDNIMARGRRIFFLDWEDFGETILPAYDLFSLVLDFCKLQDGDGAYTRKLISTAARDSKVYFSELNIPRELVGDLLAYTLVRQYHRSWQQGRTSAQSFERRLQFVADHPTLLAHITSEYQRHL